MANSPVKMTSPKNIDILVAPAIAKKLGFFSLDDILAQFNDVSLHEMVRVNSSTTFLANSKKTCYRMEYKNLTFTALEARDNFTDAVVQQHKDAYVKQPMHSISGEQQDLCFYTYGPQDLGQFLEQNKTNHYTFLPMTVHATESANGYRHDMLLIFDNRTKLFYWFDGRNREDYLPFGRDIPKNAIDILLINMAYNTKLGYSYEPSPSWMIQGVLQPFASIGQFDFVLSTAWCYLVIQMMDGFDSPTGLLSALDTLSKEDRFHLLYNALLHMIGVFRYHKTVPQNAQVNFFAAPTTPVSNQPRAEANTLSATPSATIAQPQQQRPAQLQSTIVAPQIAHPTTRTDCFSAQVDVDEHYNANRPDQHPDATLRQRSTYVRMESVDMQPMPIVSSTETTPRGTKKKDDNCSVQ